MERRRAFCIMSQRVVVSCKVKRRNRGAEAKASLKRAFSN